jgi:hypothetical protein
MLPTATPTPVNQLSAKTTWEHGAPYTLILVMRHMRGQRDAVLPCFKLDLDV